MMYPFRILNKKKYALCFLNAFVENVCLYLMPLVLSTFLSIPFNLKKFQTLIICIVVLKVIEISTNMLWNTKVTAFLEVSKKDLQLAYLNRICNMNLPLINATHTGYLKKQLDIICDETVLLLDQIMMTVNGFCLAIPIFLIQVWEQSILTFGFCFLFIIIIVTYNIVITKPNVSAQEEYNDKNAKYNATAVDFLQNIRIVKNFDALNYATDTIQKKFNLVKKPMKKSYLFSSLRSDGIHFLVYLMYFVVLIQLYFQMKNGTNVFHYLVFYSTMFSGLSLELKGVASLFVHYNKFKSANNQIEKMIIEKAPQNKIRTWNDITLKDIKFSYNDENNTMIHIPIFVLKKKDKVSIVGESGQGKSTFLGIFSRFYDIEDQCYHIDGIPTSKAPDVAYISQETDLFDLSIKDNLCLGKRIPEDVLNQYLQDAGLLEWVNTLKHGLNTLVGEKGVKLSAGQKQRLNIIRGILLNKEIYILDEPTSNLDHLSEIKIYDMIDKYLQDKTCLIVTHRPKLTEMCNRHYYFENRVMKERK